jgi:serine/threonine protein kinase
MRLISSIQVFARKLIRPFGDITVGDIENEIRAAEKLCKPGAHKNIVAMIERGKFPLAGYYFLDMELCDLSLENYIQRKWTPLMEQKVSYFTVEIPSRMKIAHIWDIMEDVTRGLSFIHNHKEIHRDLKPRNSMPSSCKC